VSTSNFLGGIFGEMPSYMGGLLGAEEQEKLRQQAQDQGLLNLGLSLLAGSGRSPVRRTTGELVAQGLQAGQQAYRGAMQQAVQDRMTALQLGEMAKKQRAEQALPGLIQGAMVAPQREFTDLERMEMRTPSVATGPARFDPQQFLQRATAAGVSPTVAIPLGQQIQSFTKPQTKVYKPGDVIMDEVTGQVLHTVPEKSEMGYMSTDQGIFAYDKNAKTPSLVKVMDAGGKGFTGEAANYALSEYGTSDPAKLTPKQRQDVWQKGVIESKKAGATNVGVNVPTQSEFGKGVFASYQGIQDAAGNARTTLGVVGQLQGFLDAGVKTGFGAESRATLNRIGQAIDPNFKVPETAGIEAVQAATAQLVLPQVKSLGANPTDKDLAFIAKSSPELSKSVEGNKLILEALRVKAERQLADADFSSRWVQENEKIIASNPIKAKAEQDRALENFRQTSPVYTTSGDQLRRKFEGLKSVGSAGLPPGVRVTRER
jgi:hypothetical protein